MKAGLIICCFVFVSLLAGCLKDEGTYTYAPVLAPVFTFDDDPQYLVCYGGDTTFLKGSFYFEKDSAKRLADVRYEWKLDGQVLSTERDFYVPTDTIIKKIGGYTGDDGLWGAFYVIEKSTGIRYMCRMLFYVRPKYWKGQWLILSENGNDSKLTYLQLKRKNVAGKIDSLYSAEKGIYERQNGSVLPGKPIQLVDHPAKNISVSVGATLILTDKAAYEVNNEDFVKVSDLKEQFLNEVPENNKIIDAYYADKATFVVTSDGKLYKRTFTENWLGGKFISEPYSVDNKGYQIAFFGRGLSSNNGPMFPCYDELNRRVLICNQQKTPFAKIYPITLQASSYLLPVWGLDEGIDVLYVAQMKDKYVSYKQGVFCLLFNQNGNTYMSDFVLETDAPYSYAAYMKSEYTDLKPFPGKHLDKESQILTSVNTRQELILYTSGNELRYVNRTNGSDNLLMKFDYKITLLEMSSYNYSYKELAVGLENGDFMFVNIEKITAPYIIKKSLINVGGRVVSASQVGCGYHTK